MFQSKMICKNKDSKEDVMCKTRDNNLDLAHKTKHHKKSNPIIRNKMTLILINKKTNH